MRVVVTVFLILCISLSLKAKITLGSPFGDHMVLQRDLPVPVWGTAEPGDLVTVHFGSQKLETVADSDGRWMTALAAMKASSKGRKLKVTSGSSETVAFADVLVGEVWICGGQSNMERQLGPRPPQKEILGWKEAVANANIPLIRQLYVTQSRSLTPQETVQANWSVCSPDTVQDFTAVGYFFARDLHKAVDVPVGIIHSSWGGTVAEAWTSLPGLSGFPGYVEQAEQLMEYSNNPAGLRAAYIESLEMWFKENDEASDVALWRPENLDTVDWTSMTLPVMWEDAGFEGVDGIGWFRIHFDLPDSWDGGSVLLELGAVDDVDTTWVNGERVGMTSGWDTPREYELSSGLLEKEGNVIVVRVLDTGGGGGIWNPEMPLRLTDSKTGEELLSLRGDWQFHLSSNLESGARPPMDVLDSPNAPTVLYNAMIAPLMPYAIRGATFYQGESNAWKADEYRTLLPAMIKDWRVNWGQGAFPFIFVQIAPFNGMPPEIREAQRRAEMATQNTAMVVTIDVGDAEDIHPANKEPVGHRLALAARGLAYGEKLAYYGPKLVSWKIDGKELRLKFDSGSGKLVSKDGSLYGFEIAGEDGEFHVAKARIQGEEIVLSAKAVLSPVSARYGWADVANGNLFNDAGLPASPFLATPD